MEERNAPGFYYIVRWRRLAENSTLSVPVGRGNDHDVQERTIDAETDTLTISGQPAYRPYEMVVLAANEIGEAASRPRPVIGYSSEAGKVPYYMTHSHYINVCQNHIN